MRAFIPLLFLFSISTLSFSQNNQFWGITEKGGEFNAGVIFKTDGQGNNYNLGNSFIKFNGSLPYGSLLEASNGKLYGLTKWGGSENSGVLFEYDPVLHQYLVKVNFDGYNLGNNPEGSLIQSSNGKLYGLTKSGGQNGKGVLFEYDIVTEEIFIKVNFDGSTRGSSPQGTLIEASNGLLYGLTSSGGLNNLGVLFKYNTSQNSFTKEFDFDGFSSGSEPKGALIEDNGVLYGLTSTGGINGYGVIFSYDISLNNYAKEFDFDGVNNGKTPFGSLELASNGKLYGLTSSGGDNDDGILFEYNPVNDMFIKKVDFDSLISGQTPEGSLFKAINDKLYGLTKRGGNNGNGVLFEFNTSNDVLTKLVDFQTSVNGEWPRGDLIQTVDGSLYGMSYMGGNNNEGVLFRYDTLINSCDKKVAFNFAPKGDYPEGSLLRASNGKIYGMTRTGGDYNRGVLFEFDPITLALSKKADFDGVTNGKWPSGSLIEASNGMLYGMTVSGGSNDYGVLFEFDPINNQLIKIFDFDINLGANPYGDVIEITNGLLYGLTRYGGTSGYGVIFEYDIVNDNYNKKFDFDGAVSGREPRESMILASDGSLYGLTKRGGVNDDGVIFEYNPSNNTYTKRLDFDGLIYGSRPKGSLIEVNSGELYGLTETGGQNNDGALFKFDMVSNICEVKVSFDQTLSGNWPNGSLIQAENNNLYGMTISGGLYNNGVLFEYNPTNDTYSKKLEFDQFYSGAYPHGSLVETDFCFSTDSLELLECNSYTVPSGQETYLTSGNYIDTIPNSFGCDSVLFINLTIYNSDSITDTLTSCNNYTWPVNGISYLQSGIYEEVFTNQSGCDSVHVLDLTILNSDTIVDSVSSCSNFTWPVNGVNYNQQGTYQESFTNQNGCDSIHILELDLSCNLYANVSVTNNNGLNCDGSAQGNAFNGTPPYTFEYSDGQTAQLAQSLCEGIYELTTTDSDQNVYQTSFVVSDETVDYNNDPGYQNYQDSLFTSAASNCSIDYNQPIDSFYVDQSSISQINMNLYEVTWYVYQNGIEYTFIRVYYTTQDINGSFAFTLSLFCQGPTRSTLESMNLTYKEEGTLSVNEIIRAEVVIYPNPVNELLFVEAPSSYVGKKLIITNSLGQQVESFRILKNKTSINMKNFPSGFYNIIIMDAENGNVRNKLIKR